MSVRFRLAPHMVFHHDLQLIVVRPRGVLTAKRIQKDIALVTAAENRSERPFNRFVDLSEVTDIRLDVDQVRRIAVRRADDYRDVLPVKSAYYVTTEKAAQIAEMCAMLTHSSALQIEVFEEIAAAARWLGVSDADLEVNR